MRASIRALTSSALFLLAIAVPTPAPATPAKNVILLIGDGMGPAHVDAAAMFLGHDLSFEAFPRTGQVTTYSANSSITDSAAAATAIATGVKVNNGVISVALPGDGHELPTALEYYRGLGRSTGLVSTKFLTDATPAAFGAHDTSRSNTSAIAGDYLNQTKPNVLFGGGGNGLSSSAATAAGYTVVANAAGMNALPSSTSRASGQFGSGNLPYEYDGLGALPHLSQMAVKTLDLLSQDPDGFFAMIEGGMIDTAAHSNDIARNVYETVEFDCAVRQVMAWAAGRTDTLIIVTADHETGGLSITQNNGAGNLPTVTWSTTGHTGVNVPIYAWGFGAQRLSGTINNTDIPGLLEWSAKPGDANGDGNVDGGDLAIWQQNYDPLGGNGDNNTFYRGDWNGDHRIDGGDLALWQQNYAPLGYSSFGSPVELQAVPEPSTLLIFAAAALSLLSSHRSGARRR